LSLPSREIQPNAILGSSRKIRRCQHIVIDNEGTKGGIVFESVSDNFQVPKSLGATDLTVEFRFGVAPSKASVNSLYFYFLDCSMLDANQKLTQRHHQTFSSDCNASLCQKNLPTIFYGFFHLCLML
jgi:hypothetical protein